MRRCSADHPSRRADRAPDDERPDDERPDDDVTADAPGPTDALPDATGGGVAAGTGDVDPLAPPPWPRG